MWVPRVMEEFFRQGDLEAEMGLKVTPFYDRTQHVTAVPSCAPKRRWTGKGMSRWKKEDGTKGTNLAADVI